MIEPNTTPEHVGRLDRQRRAIVELATHTALTQGDFDTFARVAAQVSTEALEVERVGIWMLSEDGTELSCHVRHIRSMQAHSSGDLLRATDYPRYFDALATSRAIAMRDVGKDDRVSEFQARFDEVGVVALIDAPIRVSGRVVGVLRIGHQTCRDWHDDEIAHGAAVADQISQALTSNERMRARNDAIQAREHLHHILISSPTVTLVLRHDSDEQVTTTWISDNVKRLFGFPRERFLESPSFWLEQIHKDDLPGVLQARKSIWVRGEGEFEYRFRSSDGQWRWINETQVIVRREEDGRPEEIIGSMAAIDDRKEAEEELRAGEERFRNMFEHHAAIMLIIDLEDGAIAAANASAVSFYGYVRDELESMTIFQINELSREHVRHNMDQAGDGQRSFFEVPHRVGGGTVRHVEVHATPIDYFGRRALFSIIHDVTDRRQAEDDRQRIESRMRQAQKLESLGILAGGIAHDFNNLLVGILGNIDLVRNELASDSPAVKLLDSTESAARHAADLTGQMLAYSGRGKFVFGPLDVSEVVRDMDSLIRASMPKGIRFDVNLAQNLPCVEGDSTQIRQIVLNLVTNACDAMSDSLGSVRLTTSQVAATEEDLAQSAVETEPGDYIALRVTDTGAGMNASTRSRIFDPFFTTKFTGRGLGLASVLGIVRGHRGAILVESEPGTGTSFTVLFPASRAARPRPQPAPAAMIELKAGSVLVVDDERLVRDVVSRALTKAGFKVTATGDARESLRIFEQGAFDLVVLDLTLPDMGGDEVLTEIRKVDPGARVLLMSGYAEPEVAARFTNTRPDGFLQKPYTSTELVNSVGRIMAAGDHGA